MLLVINIYKNIITITGFLLLFLILVSKLQGNSTEVESSEKKNNRQNKIASEEVQRTLDNDDTNDHKWYLEPGLGYMKFNGTENSSTDFEFIDGVFKIKDNIYIGGGVIRFSSLLLDQYNLYSEDTNLVADNSVAAYIILQNNINLSSHNKLLLDFKYGKFLFNNVNYMINNVEISPHNYISFSLNYNYYQYIVGIETNFITIKDQEININPDTGDIILDKFTRTQAYIGIKFSYIIENINIKNIFHKKTK